MTGLVKTKPASYEAGSVYFVLGRPMNNKHKKRKCIRSQVALKIAMSEAKLKKNINTANWMTISKYVTEKYISR